MRTDGTAAPGDGMGAVLEQWAERAERSPEWAAGLPADVVRAARRFVAATTTWGAPEEQVAVVAIDGMAVAQLSVQLIREGETITAHEVRERLGRTGRAVPVGTVAAALHRAGTRGVLDRVGFGRYRRPHSLQQIDNP